MRAKFLHVGLLLGLLAWAGAQSGAVTPQLIVKPLESHPVGSRVDVDVALIGNEDRPLSNQVLELYLNGEYLRRIRTEEDGTASLRISRELAIGTYEVTVVYIGTKDYTATQASLPLTIRPALLTVETVPPLPGIEFFLDGWRFSSDSDGLAQLELSEPGSYDLEVTLKPATLLRPDTKASFARWNDAVFTPRRTLEFTNKDMRLQVGFELSHPVSAAFFDLDEKPVDWSRVTAVTLKSSSAAYRTFTQDEQPYWLQANRIMRQRSGIFVTPLLWSVESVMLDGSNVVNRYQQRFYVEPGGATWAINLLLYQARIRSRDAFFGFRVGTGIALTYPDGSSRQLDFDGNNEVQMANLARGLYKLQVKGAPGVAPITPVAMTKNQDVELKVLSRFDIGTLIATGLLLAFGLLFYGRPHLIGLKRRALPSPPALAVQTALPVLEPARLSVEPQALTFVVEDAAAEPGQPHVEESRKAVPAPAFRHATAESLPECLEIAERGAPAPLYGSLPVVVNGEAAQLEPVFVDAKTRAAEAAAARQALIALFEERARQLSRYLDRADDTGPADAQRPARQADQETWSVVFKSTLVLAYLQGQASVADLSTKYGIKQSRLHLWIAAFLEAGEVRLEEVGDATDEALKTEIEQLTYRLSEQATGLQKEKGS